MRTKIIFILFCMGWNLPAHANGSRTVNCSTAKVETISVPYNDVMTIEFPEKPKTSLPGNASFDFKFIDNDLAIKSLSLNAKSNLFVYLKNDKCAFRLITSPSKPDDVVKVKYSKQDTAEVKYVK